MVLAERHEHEIRYGPGLVHFLKLLDKTIGAVKIAGRRFGVRPLLEACAAHCCDSATVAHTESFDAQTLLPGKFPNVRRGLFTDCIPGIEAPVMRVAQSPGALGKVRRIRRCCPGLTVLRNLAATVKVVEQDKLFRERMLVGCDVAAKQRVAGIAITLLEVSEYLIVGAVLLHYEQHVLDR